jgi:1,4-alpha-glucan branching enzyme
MQMPRKQRLPESAAAMTTVNIPVEFILEAPQALAVAITGGFNNWDAAQTPRQTSDYSRCRVTIVLRAGRYEEVGAAASQTVDDIARQAYSISSPALATACKRKKDLNET